MEFPTYEQFTAWLESKHHMDCVGRAQDSCSCPAAECARYYGAAFPQVSRSAWMDDITDDDPQSLPVYAQKFVSLIDNGFAWHTPIPAGVALGILKGVAP